MKADKETLCFRLKIFESMSFSLNMYIFMNLTGSPTATTSLCLLFKLKFEFEVCKYRIYPYSKT